jgi:alpha-ketoglutarate-dependent taurine dioxygenase
MPARALRYPAPQMVDVPARVQTVDLPGDFGALEVLGATPDNAADDEIRAALRAALAKHAVLCLRQPEVLDEGGLRAIAEIFGPIKDPVGQAKDGTTLRYSDERQIIDAGFVLTDELRAELGDVNFGGLDTQRPGLFETFHTDDSYTEKPASATVLNARELPSDGGGPTWFLDMRAAYRTVEPEMRRRLLGLRALHRYNNGGVFPPRVAAEGPFEALVDVTYPIVRAHPVLGSPALYIDLDRATAIEGMEEREGRTLLQFLQDHAEQNAPTYSHSWRDHDVLVWDNASVQHRASGDFRLGEPRLFWRFMIEGSVPRAFSEEPQ